MDKHTKPKYARHSMNHALDETINVMLKQRVRHQNDRHRKREELLNAGLVALEHCKTLEALQEALTKEIAKLKEERKRRKENFK
ncbi:MAG: hypothetical protein HQK63_00075 [Desulfamplus sp.]|nr:hypothetical protein [Desulfamplus sp.]